MKTNSHKLLVEYVIRCLQNGLFCTFLNGHIENDDRVFYVFSCAAAASIPRENSGVIIEMLAPINACNFA